MFAIINVLIYLYLARGIYKLNIKAWRYAILVNVIWTVSVGLTLLRVDILEVYEKMNMSPEQLELMKQVTGQNSYYMYLSMGITLIGFLEYLIYTKRYFTAPANSVSA